jgi:hypothetical protein
MKFPKFWAKVLLNEESTDESLAESSVGCWGWSEVSMEDARNRARERVRAMAAALSRGQNVRLQRYEYGERPLREIVLQEWRGPEDAIRAAITRNGYGCEVLNTAGAMFVDVDLPQASAFSSFTRGIRSMFRKDSGPSPQEQLEAAAMAKLHQLVSLDPRCSVRVYRTHSGLRYLLTHSPAEPNSEATWRAMEVLGADPLYVRLCKNQECFRARLTPKPWRCGSYALRTRYPYEDQKAEAEVDRWIQQYTRKSNGYATCAFIQQLGSGFIHPEIGDLVQLHDERTLALSDLPLA